MSGPNSQDRSLPLALARPIPPARANTTRRPSAEKFNEPACRTIRLGRVPSGRLDQNVHLTVSPCSRRSKCRHSLYAMRPFAPGNAAPASAAGSVINAHTATHTPGGLDAITRTLASKLASGEFRTAAPGRQPATPHGLSVNAPADVATAASRETGDSDIRRGVVPKRCSTSSDKWRPGHRSRRRLADGRRERQDRCSASTSLPRATRCRHRRSRGALRPFRRGERARRYLKGPRAVSSPCDSKRLVLGGRSRGPAAGTAADRWPSG